MIANPFKMPSAEDIRKKQLEEAERASLEHEAAAEHHDALATMYRGRVERLRSLTQPIDTFVDFKTGRRLAA